MIRIVFEQNYPGEKMKIRENNYKDQYSDFLLLEFHIIAEPLLFSKTELWCLAFLLHAQTDICCTSQ